MTASDLADIYAAAFPNSRAWRAEEIEVLLSARGAVLVRTDAGFALGRAIAGESELMTIAVHPTAQGRGVGHRLLTEFEVQSLASGAQDVFLEVASDNSPARALYRRAHYREVGRRQDYYSRKDGTFADALVLRKALNAPQKGTC